MGGRGTVGNSGGEGLKKGTVWRVKLGLIYYILNWFDRVSGGLTRVIKHNRVPGYKRVGWTELVFCLFWACVDSWTST